jgi:hypothetical protein
MAPPPAIEPITLDSLPEFCRFLSENMAVRRSPEQWLAGLRTEWVCRRRPNYGFLLRDGSGAVAGGLGAIYSLQVIAGREYDFCNLTSWCVKEAFRAQSMRLAMALTAQAEFEITNFSPTKVVAGVLRFLNFRELDERVSFFPNLPFGRALSRSARVLRAGPAIERALGGDLLRIYRDHVGYAWLRFVLLEAEQRQCLLVFKRTRRKGLPGAKLLYISDRDLYGRHLSAVSSAFLSGFGCVFTQVESRLLARRAPFRKEAAGYTRKLFFSRTLGAAEIDCVYSESMCLDL